MALPLDVAFDGVPGLALAAPAGHGRPSAAPPTELALEGVVVARRGGRSMGGRFLSDAVNKGSSDLPLDAVGARRDMRRDLSDAGDSCSPTQGHANLDGRHFPANHLVGGAGNARAGAVCDASQQCVPSELSDPFAPGLCSVCTLGQYCPPRTSNPYGSSLFSMCPKRHNCPTPSTIELCAPGYFCPGGTYDGGVPCPTDTSGGTLPLSLTQVMYCPGGAAEPLHCPAGYYCPNASSALPCPEGFFCAEGSNTTTACTPSLYGPRTHTAHYTHTPCTTLAAQPHFVLGALRTISVRTVAATGSGSRRPRAAAPPARRTSQRGPTERSSSRWRSCHSCC